MNTESPHVEVNVPSVVKEQFALEENECYSALQKNGCYNSLKDASQKSVAVSGSSKQVVTALVVLTVLVAMLILAVATSCTAFAFTLAKLKSESSLSQQVDNELQNSTQLIYDVLGIGRVVPSCAALPPSSPSGYYWVRTSTGSAVRVYCDMTRSCGGVTGGWTRVTELNMMNSKHQCPSGLVQKFFSDSRTCVRHTDSPGGCSSVLYSNSKIHYSRVCGKVIAYQFGHTDAFRHQPSTGISSAYVDGVSLTHGDPRQHIWTFAAAVAEKQNTGVSIGGSSCRCTNSNAPVPLSFVGTDYFCDTGLPTFTGAHPGFRGDDPLWDGAGCEPPSTCCSFNSPPWFYKQLPQPTTDDIEMRVCRNEVASNEDIAIENIEIYIQ